MKELLSTPPTSPTGLSYSIDKFAELTSLGRNRIYAEINAGALLAKKCGERTIITHEDALAWLRTLPAYELPSPLLSQPVSAATHAMVAPNA